MERRGAAFARLFEAVHEGVYIGTIGSEGTSTIAANPHLKLILRYAGEAGEDDVRPFDSRSLRRSAGARGAARAAHHRRLGQRLPPPTPARGRQSVWVELTARADPPGRQPASDENGDHSLRVEALFRDVSERKKLDDETRDSLSPAPAGRKNGGARPDGLRRRPRAEQPAGHNPQLGRASLAASDARRAGPPRTGNDSSPKASAPPRIVRNLLTFARKRQTTRAMVDINQVVRETLALRAYEQRVTNITVIDALAAGLPQVFADGHQVQQVLLNLVINAEQAMLSANGHGTLVARTWHDADQESVILEINDDGPGIPDELQPKIFDPFFTTKEVGKGTGLGLTVAYAIVQEHGGRIRLESRPNGGASFYVELPVTGGKLSPSPITRGSLPGPPEAIKGASILVVEDEAKLASAVVDALRDARLSGRARGRRRARPRAGEGTVVRSGDLRPQDAAHGRQGVLQDALRRVTRFVEARDLRDRRRRRHRSGNVPRRERLSLAGQAVQARRSAARGS